MRLEELLKTMLSSFFVITTGTIASLYVFCLIFSPDATFQLGDIGKILIMAFASDLPYVVYYSRKELSKKQMFIRTFIHILTVLTVLLYFAHIWYWIDISNLKHVAVFILLVVGVYAIVLAVTTYQDKKLSDKLNDNLKKRYHS